MKNPAPKLNFLEQNLLGMKFKELPKIIPGLLLVSAVAWASIWLSDFLGINLMHFSKSPISPVMIAIVIGLVVATVVKLPELFVPGLDFAVKKVLRLGIILLGVRLTIFDVFKLGAFGIPIVAFCIIGALLITTRINAWLRLPERLGTLIAVGTSICGVTAIVATSPAIDAEKEESAYAIATITIFGLFATLVYPYLANLIFAGQAVKAGLFLGTSVHETAQVVGAAKIYADIYGQQQALDVATVAKLVRNVFMVGVIPIMAYLYARKTNTGGSNQKISIGKLFPIFILGFLLMAVLRSIGDAGVNAGGPAFGIWGKTAWAEAWNTVSNWATTLLVVALAGVGLNTKLKSLARLGWKPFLVGLAASASVGLVSYIAIILLGSFVTF